MHKSLIFKLTILFQDYDECRLMNALSKPKWHPLTDRDRQIVKQKLLLSSLKSVTQYGSIVWDYNKYSIGDAVQLWSAEAIPWFGKIEAILVHSVDHEVLQAVLKISWFEVSLPATDSCPTKYFLPGTSDIQDPQTLVGHVLVVPDFVNPQLFFVQPHFCRYYSRYLKNKYFIK
jgi:hypothetical protein